MRLLRHTRLKIIHWVNLDQNNVIFKTLKNDFVAK